MPYSMLGYFRSRRLVAGTLNAPPTSPSINSAYIIGSTPTGAWEGKTDRIAIWSGDSWKYICPDLGLRVYNSATQEYIYNSGNGWLEWPPQTGGGGPVLWGGITGTLSNQTDLNSAIGGKSDTGHNHDSSYATAGHDHDSHYSDIAHDHNSDYSDIGHTHGQLHDRSHSVSSTSDHTFPGGTTTFLRADGTFAAASGGSDPWTIVKLANPFSTTATANTNVTGFYFTPEINKIYYILGSFMLRTATATVGARPGIAWPTNLTDGTARVEASTSLTASVIRSWGAKTTQNAASTGLATTADSHFAGLEALIVTGGTTTGNFQITLASETSGTSVTMRAGSFFMYREI